MSAVAERSPMAVASVHSTVTQVVPTILRMVYDGSLQQAHQWINEHAGNTSTISHNLPIGLSAEGREVDEHKIGQRQKQIDLGKNTMGYERYRILLPRSKRLHRDPGTPDPCGVWNKKGWDAALKKWRRLLHDYDVHLDPSQSTQGQAQFGGRGGDDDREGDDEGSLPVAKLQDGRFVALDMPDTAIEFIHLLYASADRSRVGAIASGGSGSAGGADDDVRGAAGIAVDWSALASSQSKRSHKRARSAAEGDAAAGDDSDDEGNELLHDAGAGASSSSSSTALAAAPAATASSSAFAPAAQRRLVPFATGPRPFDPAASETVNGWDERITEGKKQEYLRDIGFSMEEWRGERQAGYAQRRMQHAAAHGPQKSSAQSQSCLSDPLWLAPGPTAFGHACGAGPSDEDVVAEWDRLHDAYCGNNVRRVIRNRIEHAVTDAKIRPTFPGRTVMLAAVSQSTRTAAATAASSSSSQQLPADGSVASVYHVGVDVNARNGYLGYPGRAGGPPLRMARQSGPVVRLPTNSQLLRKYPTLAADPLLA